MNKRIKKKQHRQHNKMLMKRYPFLIPWKVRVGKIKPSYDWTFIDNIPKGWFKRFGYQMLEEIRDICIKEGTLNEITISGIKEKYGSLRIDLWYGTEELWKVLNKYEIESECTCIRCGRPAENHAIAAYGGWISPICSNCEAIITKEVEARRERWRKKRNK